MQSDWTEALEAARYMGEGSALAAALSVNMSRGLWSRAEHNVSCLEAVAKSKRNEAQKGIAVNHVETYLKLEGEEAQPFETLLTQEAFMEANEIQRMGLRKVS